MMPNANPYAPPAADVNFGAGIVAPDMAQIPAERGTRLGAALLDGLLALAVVLPGLLMVFVSHSPAGLPIMLIPVLALFIYQWYLISTRGQSIAKGWLRIKIVKLDGSPCGFLNGVLLRVWVTAFIAAGVGMVLGIGGGLNAFSGTRTPSFNPFTLVDALFIFGASRRCLHDLIAGTKVIKA